MIQIRFLLLNMFITTSKMTTKKIESYGTALVKLRIIFFMATAFLLFKADVPVSGFLASGHNKHKRALHILGDKRLETNSNRATYLNEFPFCFLLVLKRYKVIFSFDGLFRSS